MAAFAKSWRRERKAWTGRLAARFRTFQVCPKDSPAALGEARRRKLIDGIIAFGGSYLDDFNVDAETKQVLDLALEMTRTALGLADDFANGIIGKRIIELARAGERRPDLLSEGALKSLSGNLFGD
jgi:hypothetical protein